MINKLLDSSLKIQPLCLTNGGRGDFVCCSVSLSLFSFTPFSPSSSPQALNSTHLVFFYSGHSGVEGWGVTGDSEGLMHRNEKRHLYTDKAFTVSLHIYPPRLGRIPPRPSDTFPTHLFFHTPNTDTMAAPSLPLGCPTGCVNVP